jgi:hypothetical protein
LVSEVLAREVVGVTVAAEEFGGAIEVTDDFDGASDGRQDTLVDEVVAIIAIGIGAVGEVVEAHEGIPIAGSVGAVPDAPEVATEGGTGEGEEGGED